MPRASPFLRATPYQPLSPIEVTTLYESTSLITFKQRSICRALLLRAKLLQTLIKLYEPLSLIKLDWASHQSLTTTPGSVEPHLLINTKEAVRLTCFSKLDWASHQSLTNTPSSVDRLLLTNSKEAFGLTSLLLISKLDWASHQSLTTTPGSVEPHLLINTKEAVRLTCSLISKLDWASHQPLTSTPSSAESFHPLFTFIKEDLCLLSHLLTVNKFKTLIMGAAKLHQ